MTALHLVRHGQSEWNLTGRLQGQTARVPLTAVGRAQARAAASMLQDKGVSAIYSSDLLRALATAELIGQVLRLDVHATPDLRERGYGELEGSLSKDILAAHPDVDWTDPDVRIGGGESVRDVHLRLVRALAAVLDRHRNDSVVIVSHGDTIRIAIAGLQGTGPDSVPWVDVPNGSIFTYES